MMRRPVRARIPKSASRTVLGATTAAACLALAATWASAEGQTKPDTLDPIKQELAAQATRLNAANAAIAADPERQRAEVEAKSVDHRRHQAALRESPQGPDAWPTGIFEDAEAPAPGSVFLGTNRWVGQVDAGYLVVHAGRSGTDESTGRVLALWSDSARQSYTLDLEGVGALHITDADGTTLVLVDAEGTSHRLDAVSGAWLE